MVAQCTKVSGFASTKGAQCLLEVGHDTLHRFKPIEQAVSVDWAEYRRLDDELTAAIVGKVCRNCQSEPRVIAQDPDTLDRRPALRCNCDGEPALAVPVNPIIERYQRIHASKIEQDPDAPVDLAGLYE